MLWFNNSAEFDVSSPVTIVIYPVSIHTSRTPFDLDDRISKLVGDLKIRDQVVPWSDILSICLPLVLLVAFGVYDTGAGIFACGLSLGLMQGIYAMTFTNAFNAGLTAMAVLVVVIAILYIWAKRQEAENL